MATLRLARTVLSTRDAGPLVDGRLIMVGGVVVSPFLTDRTKTRPGPTWLTDARGWGIESLIADGRCPARQMSPANLSTPREWEPQRVHQPGMGYTVPVRRKRRVRMDTVTPKKRSQRGRCQRQSMRGWCGEHNVEEERRCRMTHGLPHG